MRAGRSLRTMTREASSKRLLDIVRDQDRGEPRLRQSATSSPCSVSRVSEVELAERLVEQQQRGIVDERARQRGALRHAARKLMRIGVGEGAQARPARARRRRGRAAARARRARQARSRHSSRRSPRETASGPGRRGCATDRAGRSTAPSASDRARGRLFEPGDQPQQRRLAAARGAEQRHEFARLRR